MTEDSLPRRAAAALADATPRLPARRAVIGLDGFVDEIISVVDKRSSSTAFTRVPTIAALGQRLLNAAGKSSNLELVVERTKLGGNGPIMANAMAAAGISMTYLGNVGYPHLHPAFAEMARHATIHSFAEPGHTDALEFDDGKLMLGKHAPLREVTWDNLVARVGRDRLATLLGDADLVGLQNWTMLPFLTEIWQHVLAEICPQLPARSGRTFFFDLADPEKRDPARIREAVEVLARFQEFGATCLGLNEKESFQVAAVLDYDGPTDGETAVRGVAEFIRERLGISDVVVHPRSYAVAASADGVVQAAGPFVERPLISTGAGDHFNAGFCLGKLIGADNETCLQLGVGTSGYYVRTANSPRAGELVEFLRSL